MIEVKDILDSKTIETEKLKEVTGGASMSCSYYCYTPSYSTSTSTSTLPDTKDYGVTSYWNSLYTTLR